MTLWPGLEWLWLMAVSLPLVELVASTPWTGDHDQPLIKTRVYQLPCHTFDRLQCVLQNHVANKNLMATHGSLFWVLMLMLMYLGRWFLQFEKYSTALVGISRPDHNAEDFHIFLDQHWWVGARDRWVGCQRGAEDSNSNVQLPDNHCQNWRLLCSELLAINIGMLLH